jgi:transcriptional regulator
MHPNRAFAWTDEHAMRAFVAAAGFAHILIAGPGGAAVAHAAVLVTDVGHIQFHLARSNRAVALIDAATVIVSVAAPDAYVSPDWYVSADQVPTWNYVAVEAEGRVDRLDVDGLAAHLDALSLEQETRLTPKPVWTRAKMTPGRFEAMLPAIIGFELHVDAWRGTRKLSQNKPAEDRRGVVDGLTALGRADMAALVEQAGRERA